ncbi:(2Fe-2S)-binding protein [Acerihabitans sp. KWT182]|uniref:(2Fe-2S)-binding protein n=1 Tax=Acerihabitans sp. KWT182 TaxID=3157919 RepID=A0AAU7Q455_9GAMM
MTFQRIEKAPIAGLLHFEGRDIPFHAGDTLATALLAAGINAFRRTALSGEQRGPYCLMGVCFECLLCVDGIDNLRACVTPARNGMKIQRQQGAPAGPELKPEEQP